MLFLPMFLPVYIQTSISQLTMKQWRPMVILQHLRYLLSPAHSSLYSLPFCKVIDIIQLLHFIECDMMCYGALKSNIDQGQRPLSILLFSAPQHIMLHKMKWCNCFITFNKVFFCVPGPIFRDSLLLFYFSNSKADLCNIIDHSYTFSVYQFIFAFSCISKTSVPLSVCACVTSLQQTQKTIGC